ncbi:MAG: lactate utilization protein [Acidobacteria bacterium]|nr:lactate utilization protein [Acidobacteriota bacterium]
MSRIPLDPATSPAFPKAAKKSLGDQQLRRNVRHATDVIQAKRKRMVEERDDWQDLRESGSQIRQHTLRYLDQYLEEFERNCTKAGGHVHWARDGKEACEIVTRLAREAGAKEVIKIKTMTSEEIHLNNALETAGIMPVETDLAELIIQLGEDQPSHIVVPALHKNRHQVREIFKQKMGLKDLGDTPADLAEAARSYLRHKFLTVPTAVSGANYLIAETGGVCIVESEGNGRMCLTLPETLITIAGIDKVIPLMDNARTEVLADEEGRQTLHCIRCGACQNACPVYRQTGGHAYGSVYAGPIGAILTPQLQELHHAESLPYASSLCGACYEVCPVKINIPEVLIHLRHKVVEKQTKGLGTLNPEAVAMRVMAYIFRSEARFRAAQKFGRTAEKPLVNREGWIGWLPGMLGGWTQARDLQAMPDETFREWWEKRDKKEGRNG